jgi:hypothetical protein
MNGISDEQTVGPKLGCLRAVLIFALLALVGRGTPITLRVRRAFVAVGFLVSCVVLTDCGTTTTENPAEKAADTRARDAGVFMDQAPGLSAGQRIASAVTAGSEFTVVALEAQGQAHADGVIVLSISAREQDSSLATQVSATRCYRYDIPGGYLNITPHKVKCPNTPAVAPSPAPPRAYP